MKKFAFLLLFAPLFLNAQIIQPSSSQLNFGNVMVGDYDSIQVSLTNRSNSSLSVTNVKFYSIYNAVPFSASESSFTIPANGSYSIWVYFTPIQNILHNSEMIIQHNATSGVEAIDLIGQGKFPLTYYDATENLSEQALKTALKTRTGQGYVSLSYSAARDAMFMTIDNKQANGQGASVNTLECVYTGYNKLNYTSRSDAQNTTPQFNTEHTFPQGFFNSNLPMRSDLHHLFPTTNNSNSQRGNKPFGTVTGGTPVTLGGGSYYTTSTFEPRDEQKGRTARAMMYFVIRYQDYSNHFSVQENILRSWHNSFPVDTIEEQRNNAIFTVQGNRNPFVDYPQLEERITNFVSTSVAPTQYGLDILQTSLNFGNVPATAIDTFEYVVVNRGNQSINFSNFALSNTTSLSFVSGSGSNLTLAPGEALEIAVELDASTLSNPLNESLSFSTNIPGSQGSFTIPILANPVWVSLEEEAGLETFTEVFPNPVQELLFVRSERVLTQVQLLDAMGRIVPITVNIQTGNAYTMNIQALEAGVYFLRLSDGKNVLSKRIIKQ
jgi:endonuclease I